MCLLHTLSQRGGRAFVMPRGSLGFLLWEPLSGPEPFPAGVHVPGGFPGPLCRQQPSASTFQARPGPGCLAEISVPGVTGAVGAAVDEEQRDTLCGLGPLSGAVGVDGLWEGGVRTPQG